MIGKVAFSLAMFAVVPGAIAFGLNTSYGLRNGFATHVDQGRYGPIPDAAHLNVVNDSQALIEIKGFLREF